MAHVGRIAAATFTFAATGILPGTVTGIAHADFGSCTQHLASQGVQEDVVQASYGAGAGASFSTIAPTFF